MVFLYFFHFVFIHTLGAGKVTIPSSFLVYLSFVICYNLADTKKENCMFNTVGTCAYGFTMDETTVEEELAKKQEKWKNQKSIKIRDH
jgi:hypothetical protein